MKHVRLLSAAVLSAVTACAVAQTAASGTISLVSTNGSDFNYDIQLTNIGSTGIQTFWFSWVPGLNFMPDMPSNIVSPTGWTESITGGTAGYAIQWKTNGGLAAGDALDGFQFTSIDSMNTLKGTSQGFPILTSFVYSGQPLQGTSDQFLVAPTPEPAPWLALGGLAVGAAVVRRRTKFAYPAA